MRDRLSASLASGILLARRRGVPPLRGYPTLPNTAILAFTGIGGKTLKYPPK